MTVSYVQNVESRLVSKLQSHTVLALLLYGGNETPWELVAASYCIGIHRIHRDRVSIFQKMLINMSYSIYTEAGLEDVNSSVSCMALGQIP